MSPCGCAGCELVPRELADLARRLALAEARERWEWVSDVRDRLRELAAAGDDKEGRCSR